MSLLLHYHLQMTTLSLSPSLSSKIKLSNFLCTYVLLHTPATFYTCVKDFSFIYWTEPHFYITLDLSQMNKHIAIFLVLAARYYSNIFYNDRSTSLQVIFDIWNLYQEVLQGKNVNNSNFYLRILTCFTCFHHIYVWVLALCCDNQMKIPPQGLIDNILKFITLLLILAVKQKCQTHSLYFQLLILDIHILVFPFSI